MGEAATAIRASPGGQRIRRLTVSAGVRHVGHFADSTPDARSGESHQGAFTFSRNCCPPAGFRLDCCNAPRRRAELRAPLQPPPTGYRANAAPFSNVPEGSPATSAAASSVIPADRGGYIDPGRFVSAQESACRTSTPADDRAGYHTPRTSPQTARNRTSRQSDQQCAAEDDVKASRSSSCPGPTGLVVVSDDVARSLNELEDLLSLVAPPAPPQRAIRRVLPALYDGRLGGRRAFRPLWHGPSAAGGQRGVAAVGAVAAVGIIVEDYDRPDCSAARRVARAAIHGPDRRRDWAHPTVDIVPLIDHNAVLVRAKASRPRHDRADPRRARPTVRPGRGRIRSRAAANSG